MCTLCVTHGVKIFQRAPTQNARLERDVGIGSTLIWQLLNMFGTRPAATVNFSQPFRRGAAITPGAVQVALIGIQSAMQIYCRLNTPSAPSLARGESRDL